MDKLSAASLEDAEQFFHQVIDGLCGRAEPRMTSFGQPKPLWSPGDWTALLNATRTLCRKLAAEPSGITSEALTAAGIKGDHVKVAKAVLSARAPELRLALVRETCSIGSVRLDDIDWSLKVTQASDRLAAFQEPTLSVCLRGMRATEQHETKFELTHAELKELIASLEAANKHIRELKA